MKRKRTVIFLGLFVMVLLIATESATQYFAYKAHYSQDLGDPWLHIGETPIYMPLFFLWWFRFAHDAPGWFQQASLIFFVVFVGLLALVMAAVRTFKKEDPSSHGTARWATLDEIKATKLLGERIEGRWVNRGIIVGKTDKGEYLRDNGGQHAIMIAPTGSGKGVGVVIPTLLTYPDSVIIMDIKGENWEKTSGYRQKALNNLVIKFMPTALDSARYNPLDEIRIRTPSEIKDIQNIVNILIDPYGTGEHDHFKDSAETLLTGVILHLKYAMKRPCLADVVTFFSDSSCPVTDGLNKMLAFQHTTDKQLFKSIYGHKAVPSKPYTHPMVMEYAQEMLSKPDREFGSIASTALKVLSLYRDPILAANTSRSDFLVSDLMNSTTPISLYLVFPPSDIDRMTPVCRLIIEMILRRSLEDMEHKHKLLLLLDEFPSLGRLDTLERALAYIRGYGIRALLIVQSINQLNKIYTQNNSIIDNCHIRIFYTPNESETPKYISAMLGKGTIRVKSRSYNSKELFHLSYSLQETQRELMTPDEVQRLPDADEIVFIAGCPPILAKRIRYFQDSNFEPRSRIPFPPKSDFVMARRFAKLRKISGCGMMYRTAVKLAKREGITTDDEKP